MNNNVFVAEFMFNRFAVGERAYCFPGLHPELFMFNRFAVV